VLLADIEEQEAFRAAHNLRNLMILLIVLTVGMAIGAGVFFTGRLVSPIKQLTHAATAFSQGQLEQEVTVQRADEFGILAGAFNNMAQQLRGLIGRLEQRVAERTRRLEITATLSEHLTAILDFDQLLAELVDQVKESLDYYHAHIYILDKDHRNLIMAAGYGKAGVQMKAEGHFIPLDAQKSLVAQAARSGKIVSAGNVRETENWLPNPFLPDTYSEMAVPIILEGQTVGVLDVQEDEIAALDESDANLLRSLANQVAVAIRNARLFNEVESALAETRIAQEQYVEQAWESFRTTSKSGHYNYTRPGMPVLDASTVVKAEQQALTIDHAAIVASDDREASGSSQSQTAQSIVAPIKLHNQVIGTLLIHPTDDNQQWSENDLAVVETVVDQLAQSAERLRLFEETRERGSREQLLREISDKLRAAPNLDALLEIAARELGSRLGAHHTVLEMGIEADNTNGLDRHDGPVETGQAEAGQQE
jgi:GAF domain-containing protein/HAMP domain-containing protein